jgi:hypothetical protein
MLFLLLLAGGLLRLEYSVAARKIAVVDEADGMALIYRDGVGIVAAAGMPILPGDEIRIQDDGRLSFTYRDETRGWIQAGTTLQFQPDAAKLPGLFTLRKGRKNSCCRKAASNWTSNRNRRIARWSCGHLKSKRKFSGRGSF